MYMFYFNQLTTLGLYKWGRTPGAWGPRTGTTVRVSQYCQLPGFVLGVYSPGLVGFWGFDRGYIYNPVQQEPTAPFRTPNLKKVPTEHKTVQLEEIPFLTFLTSTTENELMLHTEG